jgi:predicted neuraminidase
MKSERAGRYIAVMFGLHQGVVHSGFLYESAPFPSCHAATLIERLDGGVMCAFFGGTHERHPDVCIYTCTLPRGATEWSEPRNVADGVQPDGSRLPTWNPVLFRPKDGPLQLFYKVGPSPREWWGMLKISHDDGATWGDPIRLPDGLLGPIKNKPVQLASGRIIAPTSVEYSIDPNDDANPAKGPPGFELPKTGKGGWSVYFELSDDNGKTFRATKLCDQPEGVKAIQPSVLVHRDGRLQAIGRTQANWRLYEVWSDDGGSTWGPMTLMDMPNNNSGTDAATLSDGRHLLVYNHSDTNKVRYPLNVAVSDDGKRWNAFSVLEHEGPEQYSYPCVIQTSDGLVHVAYTWKRLRMKHAILEVSSRLSLRPIEAGQWPA